MTAIYKSDTKYNGEENIVVALDVGTTHSACSFSYLYPGDYPDVRSVIKWPGQADASGDSKIPTFVAYQGRQPKFFGAEAREVIDDPQYIVAKWFKLHLHPDSMKIADAPPAYGSNIVTPAKIEVPPLPEGVTLLEIYASFIGYMYETTQRFFAENTPNGAQIWNRLASKIVIVLCTPNGWDMAQQAFLRNATVKAGVVRSPEDAELRIEFITEGEASVHYALAHTKTSTWLTKNAMFAVTDAGGSTVDSTLYECKSTSPLSLEEVCESECVQAGGVFVDRGLQTVLEQKLKDSDFGDPESIVEMVRSFEKKTKRIFDGTQTTNILDFGGSRDNDRAHGILKGKITLSKEEVGRSFDDVIARVMESCLKLLHGRKIKHLLLVGGFGESPFLRKRLIEMFGRLGTEVVTVEEPSKKAAAEGAAIWYSKQLVRARAARYSFGIHSGIRYQWEKHRGDLDRCYTDAAGVKRIRVFEVLIKKGAVLSNDWEKVSDHHRSYQSFPSDLGEFSTTIYAWEGQGETKWVVDANNQVIPGMRKFCSLKADLSRLRSSLREQRGENGQRYWRVQYHVVLTFGRSNLQARLRWDENGVRKEGPITVLPTTAY